MIKVYRQNNYTTSHERNSFREICKLLSEHFDNDENIYLLANVELPDVTYRWTIRNSGDELTKEYKGCSPDLIVLKNDSISVIEMKGYPGLIDFPLLREDIDKNNFEWTAKYKDHPKQIINENRGNPYNQVKHNRQAFIGFLQEYEKEFSSDEVCGSDWGKSDAFILFTEPSASFSHSRDKRYERDNWWFKIHLGSMHEVENGEYFPDYIKDLTTDVRMYKKDDRSQITLDDESVSKIAEILNCQDVTSEYAQVESKEEIIDSTFDNVNAGFGIGIIRIDDELEEDQELQETYQPSDSILALPKELRILHYYNYCLAEETKHTSDIFITSGNIGSNLFFLNGVNESIFSTGQSYKVPDNEIHNLHINLRRPSPELSYGLSLLVYQKKINTRKLWACAPLFFTRVKFEDQVYQPCFDNEITVNQKALSKIPPFTAMDEPEINEYLIQLNKDCQTPKEKISKVYHDLGIFDGEKGLNLNLKELIIDDLQAGLVCESAVIYKTSRGYFTNLRNEIRSIFKIWKSKIDKKSPVTVLAYKLLNGIELPVHKKWKIPLYNVVSSNYEQSMAIGYALEEDRLISVVSGPPGTGKSQIAMNLMAEVNRNTGRVIISSKNNKAVDVVTNKYNDIFKSGEAIKRYGVRQDDTKKTNLVFDYDQLSKVNRIKFNSKIQMTHNKMQSIKSSIEKYEEAISSISNLEMDLQNLLQENPNLDFINWYSDDPDILNINYWEKKLSEMISKAKKSENFMNRFFDVLSEDFLNFDDLFNKTNFINKYHEKISLELQKKLPAEVVNHIGIHELLEFSQKFLPQIKRIEVISRKWQEYSEIIGNTNIDKFYNKWNKLTNLNSDKCIKLLEDTYSSINGHPNLINHSVQTLSATKLEPSLEQGFYEIAVLDEASQTDFISSIPILFRSKRAVIIGDENQLFPIVGIPEDVDLNIFLAYGFDADDFNKYGYSKSSLLSVCEKEVRSQKERRVMLKEHFRCHPDIIGFSNHFFYDKNLRVKTKTGNVNGVFWLDHAHDCARKWKNVNEITIVLDLLKILLDKKIPGAKIGIVAPFREHVKLLVNKIRNRFGDSIAAKVVVDTAHGFQGDEKDVILFSLVLGPSMHKSTYRWLQDGYNRNLINVAVTRARKQLFIIGNRKEVEKRGGLLSDLSDWIKYCDSKYTNP